MLSSVIPMAVGACQVSTADDWEQRVLEEQAPVEREAEIATDAGPPTAPESPTNGAGSPGP